MVVVLDDDDDVVTFDRRGSHPSSECRMRCGSCPPSSYCYNPVCKNPRECEITHQETIIY